MLKQQAWYNYQSALYTEFLQSRDEGKPAEELNRLHLEAEKLGLHEGYTAQEDAAVGRLLDQMEALPAAPAQEPSSYELIQQLQTNTRLFPAPFNHQKIEDKIHGAWMGRIAGCILGKPIEGWHKDRIRTLAHAGQNPLIDRYLEAVDCGQPGLDTPSLASRCFAGQLHGFAPEDDDTNYTVLALKLLESYGRDFTALDVAECWLSNFPILHLCTAELAAYRNLVNHILPPDSASYRNPYREWIGAQIRGDLFGYINPGDPKAAAEMAFRDACVTHTRNGIYGEMFAAAMIARAAVSDDVTDILETGCAAIPHTSRLHQSIRQVLTWGKDGLSFDSMMEKLYDRYDIGSCHDAVHTIPNAMIVAAALLRGEGDFSKTLGLSVSGGMDTDCNGATVGSVVGMMTGGSNVPAHWMDPFNDTLQTGVAGFAQISISELAARTARLVLR